MKFMVIYTCPQAVMADWMKLPEEERQSQQKKMEGEWQEWKQKNSSMLKESAGLGKNLRVTSGGVAEVKNDLMMYSVVEADTAEAAAEIFKNHPHFGIPQATIEVMPINPMPGM